MYLLVFITLVISLIGVYTQIISLQTARMFSKQTVLPQIIQTWHGVAVAQAQYAVDPNQPPVNYTTTTGGCSLTNPSPAVSVPLCPANQAGPVVQARVWNSNLSAFGDCVGAIPPAPSPAVRPCWTSLPRGYSRADYTFFSVLYRDAAGQNYIVTWVPPSAPSTDLIWLPGQGAAGASQVGLVLSDLFQQMQKSNIPSTAYGRADGGTNRLVVQPVSSGGTILPLNYPLPSGNVVPNGSLGIITIM